MRLLAILFAFTFAAAIQAQVPASVVAPNHDDWSRVQALKPGTRVLLNAATRRGSCTIQAVTPDALTCTSGNQPNVLRADIRVIKLPHRGRSAIIGAGAGAAVGALSGYAAAGPDPGNLKILSRGDVALIFAIPIAVVGAIIGFFTDFARTTFYRAN